MYEYSSIYIGDPVSHTHDWELQIEDDNCAVAAEVSLINHFGFDISQAEANMISAENGWYHPGGGGTAPDNIGNMMDMFGIDNHTCYNASVQDLAAELAAGHGVIVGINNDDLYNNNSLENILYDVIGHDNPYDMPANHAVVVTGIDMSDPSNPMVVLNDPGIPNGAGAPFPLDAFMDAWENSNCYYTATDHPLPHHEAGIYNDALSDYMSASEAYGEVVGGLVGAFTGIMSAVDTYDQTGDIWQAAGNGLFDGILAHDIASNMTTGFIEGFFADSDSIYSI